GTRARCGGRAVGSEHRRRLSGAVRAPTASLGPERDDAPDPEAEGIVRTAQVGRSAAPRRSALGVLRRLAGLLEACLLALDDARVATEEAGLLEGRAVVLLVDLVQRAGDAEAHGPGLAGRAAAVEAHDHVEAALEL